MGLEAVQWTMEDICPAENSVPDCVASLKINKYSYRFGNIESYFGAGICQRRA